MGLPRSEPHMALISQCAGGPKKGSKQRWAGSLRCRVPPYNLHDPVLGEPWRGAAARAHGADASEPGERGGRRRLVADVAAPPNLLCRTSAQPPASLAVLVQLLVGLLERLRSR